MSAETESFKLVVFKSFPLSELERITLALKVLGYEGELADNGNVVFSKTSSPVMCSMNSNKPASECTCTHCTADRINMFDSELFEKVQKIRAAIDRKEEPK